MKHIILTLLAICITAFPASADEAQLDNLSTSYAEAYSRRDLQAARDFAEQAFTHAIELYGHGAAEADQFAATYAKSLNDLLDFQVALEVLDAQSNAGEERPAEFEILFEYGRALWGLRSYDQSREIMRSALQVAEFIFGPDSLQAARTHLELARPHVDRSSFISGDALHSRIIGSGYAYASGSTESAERARAIFDLYPDTTVQREVLNFIGGLNALADGRRDIADQQMEDAMEALTNIGYMDDYVLTGYVDWVASHLSHWSNVRMERYLLRALEYGRLRREGRPIPLARSASIPYRRACIDFPDGEGGYALMEYSVNTDGQVPRTRAVETNLPDRWIEEQRRTMRTWAFVPGQSGGEPVRVDGLRFQAIAVAGRSCG